jgi:hypothetical protein
MCRSFVSSAFVSFVTFVSLSAASAARAQPPDAVGVRAQGMGGAFTAVADDATATWWNPAGLATGAYLSADVEYGRTPDTDQTHRGFALAFPALGLGYYRLTVSEIRPDGSTGASSGDRQDPGGIAVRSAELSQFGATLGQSVGGHLVLSSTLKLMRALGDTEGALDAGAMVVLGTARIGAMVRNLREPTFGDGADELTLKRQVRAGASWTAVSRGTAASLTLAVDADLRRVQSATGEERRVAGGAELWLPKRVIGVRAGVSGSNVGESRVAASGGLSAALRQGLYVDGQLTGGSDDSRRGWSAALRLTF